MLMELFILMDCGTVRLLGNNWLFSFLFQFELLFDLLD